MRNKISRRHISQFCPLSLQQCSKEMTDYPVRFKCICKIVTKIEVRRRKDRVLLTLTSLKKRKKIRRTRKTKRRRRTRKISLSRKKRMIKTRRIKKRRNRRKRRRRKEK